MLTVMQNYKLQLAKNSNRLAICNGIRHCESWHCKPWVNKKMVRTLAILATMYLALDNKDWDIQNPNMVSGRAATEDQLKTVSDEVKKQGANATDSRLAKNAAEADGAYKVG